MQYLQKTRGGGQESPNTAIIQPHNQLPDELSGRPYPRSPNFRLRSSTSVLLNIESILYPESYCSLDLTQLHSLFNQEDRFDWFRTPHYPALFHAAAAYRPLDYGSRGWRDQHRVSGCQLPRCLLLSFQGCQGGLARRDSSDPAQRDYFGRTCTRPLPRPRT